jgi:hypothetical protein
MIVHQAIGIDTTTEPLYSLLQEQKKTVPILVVVKNTAAAVATKHDMVKGAGIMYSRFTWHRERITSTCQLASLTPFSTRGLRGIGKG